MHFQGYLKTQNGGESRKACGNRTLNLAGIRRIPPRVYTSRWTCKMASTCNLAMWLWIHRLGFKKPEAKCNDNNLTTKSAIVLIHNIALKFQLEDMFA